MYSYRFIGWCRDEETNADKVWGVIQLDALNTYVTFWGRRGKKLQTKISNDLYAVNDLIYKKQVKGYRSITIDKLDTVYPEFRSDLEKTAFWSSLKA